MKLLVLEQNDTVSKIYQNIFDKKNYCVDFTKTEFECLDRIQDGYDYVVLSSQNSDSDGLFEAKIREKRPQQKIYPLSTHLDSEGSQYQKETQEILEKPFALLTMVAKIESEKLTQDY